MNFRQLTLLLLAGLLAWSCNRNAVKVVEFDPQGEVKDLQSFTITFDKDLAPIEHQGEWSTEEYISFEPPIPGRFKWLSASTLLFSPDRPLMPSQAYTAKINGKAIRFNTSFSLDADPYTFNTPFFTSENAEIFVEQVAHGEHKVQVLSNLYFNYEVAPEALKEHLQVTRDGQPVNDFSINSDKPSKELVVNFGEFQQTDKEQEFVIVLKEGLSSVLGRSPLEADRQFSLRLPPITQLAISGATAGYDGQQGWIEIMTTQQADPSKVAQYIEIAPSPGTRGLQYRVDQNHIRIEANFTPGDEVQLKVKAGMPGLYGGTLKEDFTQTLAMADLAPKLSFADKGLYLMRGGQENINIEAINIDKAEVRVYEVFKNNLLFFFYQNYEYNQLYYADPYYDDYGTYYDVNYFGKELSREDITFKPSKNLRQAHTLNMHEALDQRFKGIYMVQVNSDQDWWLRDARLVTISDIGLITKFSETELLVFANSLKTALPMADVQVKLISSNNQTLLSGVTGADGVVRFENIQDQLAEYSPALVIAEKGDDFNFVDVRNARVDNSRYEVEGKSLSAGTYDAFLYGDRNLYRPGETAHITGIIRDANFGVVRNVPMVLKIRSPRGKEFATFQQELNAQGAFEVDFDLPDFAETGQYLAELFTGDDTYVSSYRFSVEEFVPDKIRVMVKQDKEKVAPGEKVTLDIKSEYLFGAPAADARYEVDVRLRHIPYRSERYPKFDFSNNSVSNSGVENQFFEGTLDAEGKSTQEYTLPSDLQSGGYLRGTATVSVFDVTGRTVNQYADFNCYPNAYYLGMRSGGYYYTGTNSDIEYEFVAVNPQDEAIKNFSTEVTLIRYEWKTVLTQDNRTGRYRYVSEKRTHEEWTKPLALNGQPGKFTFQVSKAGQYELRLSAKGKEAYISQHFYAYHMGRATASSFEIDKEGRVEIILDKEKYAPGDRVKALFVTPFTGRMLVTIERDKVLEHRYVEVTENSTEVIFSLGSEHLPNAYISATLFRPHSEENSSPFLVGHGYANVSVEDQGNHLPVTIVAPEGKVKPRTRQTITVKTAPRRNIYVTLAAVDEGILQIKNYKTPDPYSHMYAKRRLMVESFDIYKYLLPEVYSSTKSPAGGDEAAARARRLNPVKSKRFKLLAYWSGIRQTDGNGEVKISLDLPQYNGEVRLMAVAYEGGRFGSADRPLTVADDIILEPAVPRFLAIGDSLHIPVTVMNTIDKSGQVKVSMEVEGPLKLTSSGKQSVNLDAKGSSRANFTLVASEEVGTAKIKFTTSGMAEVTEEIEIGVRPISPLVVESDGGSIKAGATQTLSIPGGFIPGTQMSGITVSTFPAKNFSRHLRYLVGYPYGCAEQTTSKAFPQLYFADLAAQVAPDLYKNGNPVYYVNEAIQKLQGMARYDGAFTYWPGGSDINWWASVYATHFLVEAKKAGYQVNQSILDQALNFLVREAANRDTYTYRYYDYTSQTWVETETARKEVLYSLYILALAGKPELSFMNFYRARPKLLRGDGTYLLAGAFALSKDWSAFNELMPGSFRMEKPTRTTGGSFDSEYRSNALMLNVLMDVDPNNKQVPQIVKYLSDNLESLWSTQDRAWTYMALGKVARKMKDSEVDVEVLVDGKTVSTIKKSNGSFFSDQLNGKTVTLKATGKGETFYAWSSEGIKSKGVPREEDVNLQVRRNYYDRNGTAISNNRFEQGDLIVAEIFLKGGPRSVENVAISDLIPSGFEIENPRLNQSANLAWIDKQKDRFTPTYLDVRDDRMLLFTDVNAGQTLRYFYLIRVVNSGTFNLPAIGAEAMYDPDYRSYHGAGKVRVE